jgi:hypothetical protein
MAGDVDMVAPVTIDLAPGAGGKLLDSPPAGLKRTDRVVSIDLRA